MDAIGSAGAAYADDHQNAQLLFHGGSVQAVGVDEAPSQGAGAVAERYPTERQVMTVSDAVAKSLQTKQAVPLFVAEPLGLLT